MNPFTFFEKIYCINLDDRPDRWEKCLDIFKEYELDSCERVSGIKILEKEFVYLDEKSRSQLGCSLAFYTVLKNAYDNKFKNILIFEDDFFFTCSKEDTRKILNNSIKNLPENWDVFYLGANVMYDYCVDPIVYFKESLFKINSAYCMHSIAFSEKGISKFIEKFPNEIVFIKKIIDNYKILDVFMAKEFCLENYCFITNEMLCTQSVGFSSIENCIADYSDLINRYNRAVYSFYN